MLRPLPAARALRSVDVSKEVARLALSAMFPPGRQAVERLYPLAWLGRFSLPRFLSRISAVQLLALVLTLNIAGSLLWALDRQDGLQDLGSFLHSGAAQREGLDPYGYYPGVQPQPISPDALNLNPPVTVYLFDPLSRVDTTILRHAFLAGTAAIFALGVLLLLRAYPDKRDPVVLLAVFSLAGLWHLFGYLQLYAPLFLAGVGAWLMMRRGNALGAAVLIGLIVAIKPNFVLWPLFLLMAGHQRIGIAALATTAAVSAIPLIVDGPAIYESWLALSLSFDGLEWASNVSLMSIGARFGLEQAGYIAGLLVVLVLLALQWRLRPSAVDSSTFGIMAALLFGPASWAGYTLFLLPYLFGRQWSREVWVSVLLLCTPFWLVHYLTGLSPLTNAVFGPIYGWAVLLLLASMVAQQLNLRERAGRVSSRAAAFAPGVYPHLRGAEPAANVGHACVLPIT